jgi:tetratricopeptide (TPR) repeat protein
MPLPADLRATMAKSELPKGWRDRVRFARSFSEEIANMLADGRHLRIRSLWRWALRAGIFVWILVRLPWASRALRKPRKDAVGGLYSRLSELWQTAPYEALQLLRSVSDELNRHGLGWKDDSGRPVHIDPFGRFAWTDAMEVRFRLLEYELSFSHYDEALALCQEMPEVAQTVLMRVKCLEKMGRKADAIALLEQKLAMDNWRGDLRAELASLVGHPGAGLN